MLRNAAATMSLANLKVSRKKETITRRRKLHQTRRCGKVVAASAARVRHSQEREQRHDRQKLCRTGPLRRNLNLILIALYLERTSMHDDPTTLINRRPKAEEDDLAATD
jgi:hypothetical protein